MTRRQQLDLNLFRVFNAIVEQGSVAGAARQLRVTASAVSHSLARLRKAFDDPLFTPSEAGMSPTERARAAHPLICAALAQLDAAVGRQRFDPTRSSRVFTVSASHYSCVIVLPSLVGRLAATAPEVGLILAPFETSRIAADLNEGAVTLAIGRFGKIDPILRRQILFTDDEVVLCRSDHPLCRQPVDWKMALRFPRVKIQAEGGREIAEASAPALQADARRAARRSAEPPPARIVVSDESPIAPILEDSDFIAIGPRRLALRTKGRLAVVEPTDRRVSIETEIAWHPRVERDAGAAWLIRQIADGSYAPA